MAADAEAELRETAAAWDRAMTGNDAGEIGRFMADEWVIIGSDGVLSEKPQFLAQISGGRLTHHTMTTDVEHLRVYGTTGILIATGVSAGHFDGHAFEEHERQSNVFVKRDGEWKCVLTHLSRIGPQ